MTKDNMLKRKWIGDFCDSIEPTDHLFFQYPVARVVWSIVALCLGPKPPPVTQTSSGDGLLIFYQMTTKLTPLA